jgi:hypothetical protein
MTNDQVNIKNLIQKYEFFVFLYTNKTNFSRVNVELQNFGTLFFYMCSNK